MYEGDRLYADVIEVNPPLAVWLNLPVVALARAAGWSEIWLYRALVWSVVLVSLLLSDRALRRLTPPVPAWGRRVLLVMVVVLLAGMPGAYFGQREHLALALLFPWLVHSAAQGTRRVAGAVESSVLGGLAAVGVALKPHYLLLPVAVALYRRATAPRGAGHPATDLLSLGLVLAAYGVVVPLLAPEYLTLAARLGPVYWDYVRRPLAAVLAADLLPLAVLWSLGFWPVARRLSDQRRLVDVLGLATAALFAAVVLQHKGFGYHYFPALGTGLLLVVLGLLGGGSRLPAPAFRIAAQGAGLLVLLPTVALFLGSAAARAGGGPLRGEVAAAPREIGAVLESRRPAGAVVVFSPRMNDAFPLVLERGLVWGSRYPFLWFLPALHRRRLEATGPVHCSREPGPSAAERELVGTVAEDLRRHRPELVFVRKTGPAELLRLPVLTCLSRVDVFRREFRNYRPVMDLEYFQVYQRSDL